ncbi:MAG: 2'-5' RNA ligase family protein, partial [Brasilonema sp.]
HNPPLFQNEDVVKVHELFTQIIPKFQSFTFHLEGLILFPTSVSLVGYCDETLRKLVQALDLGLKEIGVPDNKKYISDTIFFGNMTLCRLTHEPSSSFQNKVKELESIYIGEMRVTEISLIICNAVCHPKTKKVIGTYKLSE